MKLRLERDSFTATSTEGTFYIDGAQFCWTLELPSKDGLPGSCIPPGTYRVKVYPSPKFGRLMPLLVDVPMRSNIEIHWGNTAKDTEGCILLGGSRPSADFIGQSRQIFDDFWAIVQDPIEAGDCSIEVVGGAAQTQPAELNLQGDT